MNLIVAHEIFRKLQNIADIAIKTTKLESFEHFDIYLSLH